MKMLCIYADYKSDESYTPSKISVRVGNNFHNLQEVRVRTYTGPTSIFTHLYHLHITYTHLSVSAAARDGGAKWVDSHLPARCGN